MKFKRIQTIVFVLLISLVFTTPGYGQAGNQETSLVPVQIRNRTDQPVGLLLFGEEGLAAYALNVPANTDQTFTVQKGGYDQTTFACGESASGTLDISGQLRLTFTRCPGSAPNAGAPTIEKVHLTDAPSGKAWLYQYGGAARGLLPSGPGGSAGGACSLNAREEVTIYQRPSTAADVFSTQPAGFSIDFSARTATGWLGFDPGIAQAANLGSFRLRWVPPDARTLSGACSSLPVVWGPPPGICFDMPMGDTSVYEDPDASSPVEVVLHPGEFAAILGLTAGGDWAQVDLRPGNTGLNVVGWVDAGTLNVNGPCGGLPTVSP